MGVPWTMARSMLYFEVLGTYLCRRDAFPEYSPSSLVYCVYNRTVCKFLPSVQNNFLFCIFFNLNPQRRSVSTTRKNQGECLCSATYYLTTASSATDELTTAAANTEISCPSNDFGLAVGRCYQQRRKQSFCSHDSLSKNMNTPLQPEMTVQAKRGC